MQKFAEGFYGRTAWKNVRQQAMKRDAYLCVDCMKKGLYTPAEEVHHITPLTPQNIDDPSVSLNLDNLVSLCRDCHELRHKQNRSERYIVDELGRVITI